MDHALVYISVISHRSEGKAGTFFSKLKKLHFDRPELSSIITFKLF